MKRRLLERFALIAFGLYHIPLFLNNYPSLGGGGFNDSGLAPRWGHVFTEPGIWVARVLFHMTGPMRGASSGDNGDVGEEFARLIIAVAIAMLASVVWTATDRKRPGSNWVGNALRVMLRYSIALGLASYAVAKLLPQQFPPLNALNLENRLGDLTPMRLLWNFMQYSRPYNFFGGVMEMAAVVLLCFRRTATLGALVCLVVMTNVALLNLAYGVQVKLYSIMIVVSAAVLVLYDTPRLLAMFVQNKPVPPAGLSPAPQDRMPAPLRWTIKVAFVGGVLVSSWVAMAPFASAQDSARASRDGGWIVTSFARDGRALDSTADPARWRRIAVAGGGLSIRLESDSLLRCGFVAGTNTVNCAGSHKGDLEWQLDSSGPELKIFGTFDGARVSVTARRIAVNEYPLLRSKFRWIYDRP